jgi:TPR repeat protein
MVKQIKHRMSFRARNAGERNRLRRNAAEPKPNPLAGLAGIRTNTFSSLLLTALVLAAISCKPETETASSPTVSILPDFAATKTRAEAGDVQAQNVLGEIYAEGKQVRGNYAEAAKWYRAAAEKGFQGLADAQYNIAGMYGLGRGVGRNPKEALRYYNLAAEQGDALSRYNLAERYERAKDVKEDLVEAYKWHTLAADVGFKDGVVGKKTLEGKLNSQQLAEARKRIEEYRAKHPLVKK